MSHDADPSAASPDIQQGEAGIYADIAAPALLDFVGFTIGDGRQGVDSLAARQIASRCMRHSRSALSSNRKRSPNFDADAL